LESFIAVPIVGSRDYGVPVHKKKRTFIDAKSFGNCWLMRVNIQR
jgi:hypothetical protein